ncbi:MAG: hypothetical protein GY839_10295 [candidate division Zixibacteria bacterium]|nr:hypothetical protein [candidate division Zixibacteria bacterium]
MNKPYVLAMVVIIACCISVSATIINVPADQPKIQDGINTAIDGDTVLVQPDTYVENINFTGRNIVVGSLFLTTGDTTYISTTIIDGDSVGTVVSFMSGEDSTAMITGFTITNGAGGGTHSNWFGGGITCNNNSNPAIINNIVTENIASRGGGIHCHESSPRIINNKIMNNESIGGGGIGCKHEAHPIIEGNVIEGNSASGGGGVLGIFDCNLTIHNNLIKDNHASDGGGIQCNSDCNSSITNNIIVGNHASGHGGGIDCYHDCNMLIYSNTVIGNTADSWGGGIRLNVRCIGIVSNNVIAGNAAGDFGGGIYCCYDSDAKIINNTIAGNSAGWYGGGVGCMDALPTIANCILWGNTAIVEGDEVHDYDGYDHELSFCDVQNGWPGDGNLSVDPMFRDPLNYDYHLMAIECGDPYDSPCIDTGDPYYSDSNLNCSWGLGTELSDIGAFGGGMRTLIPYLPGDVGMLLGGWPPMAIGGDVTWLVGYFRGHLSDQPCLLDGFWASADANGDCIIIGSDLTKLVNYFRGLTSLSYCPEYPPAWPTSDDLPAEAPEGWPNCE